MSRSLLLDLVIFGGGPLLAFVVMDVMTGQLLASVGVAALVAVAMVYLAPRTQTEVSQELLGDALSEAEVTHRKIGGLIQQVPGWPVRALLAQIHEKSASILDLMRQEETLRQEAPIFRVNFLDPLADRLNLYVRLRTHQITRAETDLTAMEREDFPGALDAFEGFRQSLFQRDLQKIAGARSGPTFKELDEELWGGDATR